MATQYIDTALKGTPVAGYGGQGTLNGNVLKTGGVHNMTSGFFTATGEITVIKLGFVARKIRIINSTDGIIWDKQHGMAAANSYKTVIATPAITLDTGSAILIGTDGTVTLSAALAASAKSIAFCIEG